MKLAHSNALSTRVILRGVCEAKDPSNVFGRRFSSLVIFLLTANSAHACAMCMGAKDAPVAPAVNASIFLLLGVLAVVATCVLRFVFFLARHDGTHPEPNENNSVSPIT